MIIIKVFLILVVTIGLLIFSFSSKLKIIHKLIVIIGYCTIFFFIAEPQYSDKVAHFFSIEKGKDLVLYIATSIISLVNVILYVDQKNTNKMMTKIVRGDAKQRAKQCNES